jgi:hypothetical protein
MKYQPRGYNYRPKAVVTTVAIPYFATSNIKLSNALEKISGAEYSLLSPGGCGLQEYFKRPDINQHFNMLEHSCDTVHHTFGK